MDVPQAYHNTHLQQKWISSKKRLPAFAQVSLFCFSKHPFVLSYDEKAL